MREILFRGKRMDGKGWVEGWYYQLKRSEKIVHYIVENPLPKLVGVKEYEVYPTTVGQFTGLLDKNGKQVFEGDIIKSVSQLNDHHQKGATEILVVRYWCGNACLCFKNQESGVPIFPFCVGHEIEVIGNIHDNPELLEATP